MSVTADNLSTKLQIRSNYGVVDGKDVIKSKTYSHLKSSAENDDIYAIATTLAGLQEPLLEDVIRVESTLLIPEA